MYKMTKAIIITSLNEVEALINDGWIEHPYNKLFSDSEHHYYLMTKDYSTTTLPIDNSK